MGTYADKVRTTVYTIDDFMVVVLDLRKSNTYIMATNMAIQATNTAIQESVAALELLVKALELKPRGHASLLTAPKDLPPSTSLLLPSSSQAATDLVANLTTTSLVTTLFDAGLPKTSPPFASEHAAPRVVRHAARVA